MITTQAHLRTNLMLEHITLDFSVVCLLYARYSRNYAEHVPSTLIMYSVGNIPEKKVVVLVVVVAHHAPRYTKVS